MHARLTDALCPAALPFICSVSRGLIHTVLSGAACATIAEVRKRGDEFWSEFEFYLSDLTVGLVLDVLLVGLMATPAVIGKHHKAHNTKGGLLSLRPTPQGFCLE